MIPRSLASVLLAGFVAGGCLAPGVDIAPAPSDFAFLEIHLQG